MCSVDFNRLESLSNELLLDIFEYLDAYDLCQAFYNLNSRINTLLRLAHLHILHNSSKNNNTIWNTLLSFLNSSQIRTLSSYDNINIHKQILSSNKQNLRLADMDNENIDEIFQYVPPDNQIKRIILTEKGRWNYATNVGPIADVFLHRHGHRFTSLVNLSLSFCSYRNNSPNTSAIFLQLHHLSINNCKFTPDFIEFLQNNTPNLRSLQCLGTMDPSIMAQKIVIKHIYELHIDSIDNVTTLQNILSLFPSLRRLHIHWISNRRYPVAKGKQWQWLIENYLSQLKQLTIDFGDGVNEDIVKTFYEDEFWSTKNVYEKMRTNKIQSRERLVTTIHFGQQWRFEYFDHL